MKHKTKVIIYIAVLISLIAWLVITFATGQWNEIWNLSKEITALQIKSILLAWPVYILLIVACIILYCPNKK